MKRAFCWLVGCCLCVGAAIVAVLAAVLMAPVTVLFIANAILTGLRTRREYFPHDSGSVLGVVLTVFTAVVWIYMFVYDLVGLQSSFIKDPFSTVLMVLVLILCFYRPNGKWQQVTELFSWAYLSFDRRIAAIWSAFIFGMREAVVSFFQVVLTWLFLLALTGIAIYMLADYVIAPLLRHAPEGETGRHVIKALMWLLLIVGMLVGTQAILNFVRTRKSKFGWTIPRIVDLPFNSDLTVAGDLRIAHLSDLHIPYNGKLTEKKEWRPEILDRCIGSLDKVHEDKPLGAIVFSGDVTDTGHQDAWTSFISKFARYKDQTVLAPGNHDLNVVGYGALSIFLVADESHMGGRWKRMVRYMEAASQVMGTRAHVWSNGGLQPLPVVWEALQNDSQNRGIHQYSAAAGLFPFVVTVPGIGEHVKFMVWNTVRTSALAINNSYGIIEKEQLANFEKIVAHFSEKGENVSYIHVMHHKLAFPAARLHRHDDSADTCGVCGVVTGLFRALKHRIQIAGMVMLNAGSAIETVAKGGSSVVLHGHHHASFWGQIQYPPMTMHVVSAPSTTLGTETSITGACVKLGFDVLELTTSAGVCALAAPPSRIGI